MNHRLQVEWQSAICSLVKLGASHGEVMKFIEDQVAQEEGRRSQHFAAALCLFLLGHRPLEIVNLLVQGTGDLLDDDISQVALRQVLELGETDDHVAEALVEARIRQSVAVTGIPWLRTRRLLFWMN